LKGNFHGSIGGLNLYGGRESLAANLVQDLFEHFEAFPPTREKEKFIPKSIWRHLPHSGKAVGGRRNGEDGFFEDQMPDEILAAGIVDHEPDLGEAVEEHLDDLGRLAHPQPNADSGKPGMEPLKDRREGREAGGDHGPDRQAALRGTRAHLVTALLNSGQGALYINKELSAFRRESHASAPPSKKLAAQVTFQSIDVRGDGWL
jgi:hypothetical protein